MDQINLNLSNQDVQVIFQALGNMPAKMVFKTLIKIEGQLAEQQIEPILGEPNESMV